MAGDCTYDNTHYYGSAETFCPPNKLSDGDVDDDSNLKGRGGGGPMLLPRCSSSNFEEIDGLLYRKKLERGFIHYREVLAKDRRHEAISAFHRRRPVGGGGSTRRHLSLEETYKCVSENYWWDGMYFQIREHVLGCPECLGQHNKRSEDSDTEGRVAKTMPSHSSDVLSKLRSQREAGLFCDITLHTSGQSYSAHRAVLAAVSEYFQEIFTQTELSAKADIDLTGYSEESLLSLLDFSYSSTLCVRQEDLPEVSTLARHLGMWPAVEACSVLQREQEQPPSHCPRTEHLDMAFPLGNAGSRSELHHQLREKKGKKVSPDKDSVSDGFSLTLDTSDESLAESPRRSLRRPLRNGVHGHNEHPLSPTHRMKLMDFKSPSCKRSQATRNASLTPQSRNRPASSPPTTRLLRSSPGAAQEVLKLLPRPESPRRNRKSHSVPRPSPRSRQRPSTMGSPLRVKQEAENIGEDEQDYARAQEKYRLMNVLGLQRTALLPRPEDLIGWRQKKRLRKLKANNYSLTKRRKTQSPAPGMAFEDLPLSIPLCNPVNTRFLKKIIKTEPGDPVIVKEIGLKRSKTTTRHIPPSDRSMRSKVTFPDLLQPASWPNFGGRELRHLARRDAAVARPGGSSRALPRNMVRIKPEPVDYSISSQLLPSCERRNPSSSYKPPPPLRTRSRNKTTLDNVRILRYNSGRPAAKTKLKQSAVRGAKKSQSKNREEERKVLTGLNDCNLRAQDNKSTGIQIPNLSTPSSLYNNPLYKVIKEEPADPLPVTVPFPDPPSPDRGKRQSKPPVKLLDPGFLFSFYRPAGGAMVAGKREEESVDICLMRSVSQGETFRAQGAQPRVLRARSGPPTPPHTRRERDDRSLSQKERMVHRRQTNSHHNNTPILAKCTQNIPKLQKKGNILPSSNKKFVLLESISRARLKQLRGPRSQAPKALKGAHNCVECHASYKDCDALIMHSLKHIEGKHWPCPLCSKTFFRLRNVRNHIRNHDQKLYKCRGCIAAAH